MVEPSIAGFACRAIKWLSSNLLDYHAPLRTKDAKLLPSVPWIIDEVRLQRKGLRKAERIWRPRKLTIFLDIFTDCRRAFNRLLWFLLSQFLVDKGG
jgi:hypothetical protein